MLPDQFNPFCMFKCPVRQCLFVFEVNVPPTTMTKVLWRWDIGLKSHLKGWWNGRSNAQPLVYKASDLSTSTLSPVAQLDARSTGDQEGVSSRLRSGNILSVRLIMKSFLRSSLPSADSRREVVSYLRKNVH